MRRMGVLIVPLGVKEVVLVPLSASKVPQQELLQYLLGY